MRLTTDDYDPGFLERPYVYPGDDPYPPPSEEIRTILTCLPEVRGPPENLERLATNIVSALDELDVDPAEFADLMEFGSAEYASLPTPGDSAANASFDADYEYEYEYLSDVATIELAPQTDTPLYEPQVGWRVTADAGTVAGTNGQFGSLHDTSAVKYLYVSEAVEYGDDAECPIIAGARFGTLPVPGRVARELNDRLSEMRTVSEPGEDVSLGDDPTAFPAALTDPVISDDPIREPFAWDADRLVLWYDNIEPGSFDPTPYQIEDGAVTARSRDHQYREQPLPDTRESLIESDDLERISPDALKE